MSGAVVARVWYGAGAGPAIARAVLAPAELAFRAGARIRDVLYDNGVLTSAEPMIPAVGVGNLTVGGTGKTPMSAWVADALAQRGRKPAIVLRGYGTDEPEVHRRLNPGVPVVTGVDRLAAIARAAAEGADIAVLDDAFQQRRARRRADILLVSADAWTDNVHLLPAGPWRAPLDEARRANVIVITRKAAATDVVERIDARLDAAAPGVPRARVHLAPGVLVDATDAAATRPLDTLRGARLHAILSIADPSAFVRQMEQLGGHVRTSVFPDHHDFTQADAERLAATTGPAELTLCTLKDAVKLAPHWTRLGRPLWYVSQRVIVERGGGELDRLLDDVSRARSTAS